MQTFRVFDDAEAVAGQAARTIADEMLAAVSARGQFLFAVSGGRTPWLMLRALAEEPALPWEVAHIFQVDERIAPPGDPDRNLTHLQETLAATAPIPPGNIHPMPVELSDELSLGRYAAELENLAGTPPILDLVHLGLGTDGHTASLVPNDPVLEVSDRDLALTGLYQNRRRMTLTFPAINRARRILWVVTGADKAPMLTCMRQGDPSIPAGRIRSENAVILADKPAAGAS